MCPHSKDENEKSSLPRVLACKGAWENTNPDILLVKIPHDVSMFVIFLYNWYALSILNISSFDFAELFFVKISQMKCFSIVLPTKLWRTRDLDKVDFSPPHSNTRGPQ